MRRAVRAANEYFDRIASQQPQPSVDTATGEQQIIDDPKVMK